MIGQSTIDINFESKGVNVLTVFFWLARQGEREAGGKSVREAGLPVGGLGVAQDTRKGQAWRRLTGVCCEPEWRTSAQTRGRRSRGVS